MGRWVGIGFEPSGDALGTVGIWMGLGWAATRTSLRCMGRWVGMGFEPCGDALGTVEMGAGGGSAEIGAEMHGEVGRGRENGGGHVGEDPPQEGDGLGWGMVGSNDGLLH